ncbi:IS1182 family transposase, partial [Sedimentibacter hydroxybenzoicus DSM 7310]|nr:IS1182 family transposase [Sedimentibacter hydroxybenzoicus DSM 7310]
MLKMQRYEEGTDRNQVQVVSLEDLIGENNPVRVIDAFVNSLDIEKMGFQYAQTKETGRKPMNPSDMSKLYIYGYFNGIRTSRKLEKECEKNIEVMWLINNLKPHNKTISEFRRNNKKALENIFREFSMLCNTLNLIGKEMVAIDGSKFRAHNSRKRNYTKNKVKKMIEHFEESASQYLELLEKGDKEDNEQTDFTKENITEKFEAAKKRIEELKEMYEDIKQNGEISITDKDARHMSVSNNGTDIAHNVQIAVDSKNHLVVAVDVVSNPADQGQLYNIAKQAAKELGIELKNKEENQSEEEYEEYLLTILADKGYYEYENLKDCLDSGIKPIVAKENASNKTGNKKYIRDNFIYDKEKDIYICPEGKILNNVSNPTSQNQLYRNKAAC